MAYPDREITKIPPHMLQPIPADKIPELFEARDGFASLLAHLENIKSMILAMSDIPGIQGIMKTTGGTFTGPVNFNAGINVSTVDSVSGVSTSGAFGVSTVLANASEVPISSTSNTTVISFLPEKNGNFLIYIYLRVKMDDAPLNLQINYTDAGGQQQQNILSDATQNIGSYSIAPIYINAIANSQITVSATSQKQDAVFVSATLIGL